MFDTIEKLAVLASWRFTKPVFWLVFAVIQLALVGIVTSEASWWDGTRYALFVSGLTALAVFLLYMVHWLLGKEKKFTFRQQVAFWLVVTFLILGSLDDFWDITTDDINGFLDKYQQIFW